MALNVVRGGIERDNGELCCPTKSVNPRALSWRNWTKPWSSCRSTYINDVHGRLKSGRTRKRGSGPRGWWFVQVKIGRLVCQVMLSFSREKWRKGAILTWFDNVDRSSIVCERVILRCWFGCSRFVAVGGLFFVLQFFSFRFSCILHWCPHYPDGLPRLSTKEGWRLHNDKRFVARYHYHLSTGLTWRHWTTMSLNIFNIRLGLAIHPETRPGHLNPLLQRRIWSSIVERMDREFRDLTPLQEYFWGGALRLWSMDSKLLWARQCTLYCCTWVKWPWPRKDGFLNLS